MKHATQLARPLAREYLVPHAEGKDRMDTYLRAEQSALLKDYYLPLLGTTPTARFPCSRLNIFIKLPAGKITLVRQIVACLLVKKPKAHLIRYCSFLFPRNPPPLLGTVADIYSPRPPQHPVPHFSSRRATRPPVHIPRTGLVRVVLDAKRALLARRHPRLLLELDEVLAIDGPRRGDAVVPRPARTTALLRTRCRHKLYGVSFGIGSAHVRRALVAVVDDGGGGGEG